ncbi:hypothetical protein [Kitasatospora sp. NPDC056531]|uniref:hypothetical protein n=1 Tax=Kitasatospora sp. NPDC056531 TaxID=3345856 RepID=UPI0036BC2A04
MDFYDLTNAKVDSLGTAAGAWDEIAGKLRAMDGEWNSGVVGKVNGSGWTGKDADAAKPALQRGNDQLNAAAVEAGALASVLREAATDIQAAKDKLSALVTEATTAGLTVSSDGTVSWPDPDKAIKNDPQAAAAYHDKFRSKAGDVRARIDSVLREATEADQRACFALRSDASADKDGSFNAQAVGGGPEADAKRAAQLAAKGKKLTDPELLELNSLLAAHGGDPVFTTRFYETVGPKGLLVFWDNMVGADSGVGGVSDTRLQQYRDLQKNLGTTLATATRTSNQPHLSDQWEAELRKAGAELLSEEPPVGMGTPPYIPRGYQVLAGILRTGNYDPHFLNPIAEHVLQLDAKDTNRTRPFWPDFGGDKRGIYSIVGQDGAAGYQPLTGILEALAHSPEAATKFFHDQPTAYNTDGTVNPNGKPKPADYLHYLAHDKEFKPDTLSVEPDVQAKSLASGPTAFGHALEAATSGHPYDDMPSTPTKHNADQADVMNMVMKEFGQDEGGSLTRITDKPGHSAPLAALRPSLGRMAADYMGDIQQAMSPWDHTLPTNGQAGRFDSSDVRSLLNVLGRDPAAYGSVINAQQAYTTGLIHVAFAGGETDTTRLALPVENAAASGGTVAGIINEARADAVFKQHAASDKAFNDAVQSGSSWAKKAFSTALGGIPNVVPDLVGVPKPTDFIVDQILQSVTASVQQDTTAAAQVEAGHGADGGRNANAISAAQAVRDAAKGSALTQTQVEQLAARVGGQAAQGGAVGAGANSTANGTR